MTTARITQQVTEVLGSTPIIHTEPGEYLISGQVADLTNTEILPDWGYRVKVNIDPNQDLINSDLTHHPLLLNIGLAVGQGGVADLTPIFDELSYADRFKIAITKKDGVSQLYGDIEHWDSGNEKAVIHVSKSDFEILADFNNFIYIYYDSTQEDNTTYISDSGDIAAQSVWDANYVVVQHMNQDPSGSAPQIPDSTVNNEDGTSSGTMLTEDLVDWDIGKAIDFDGSNDYIGTVNPLVAALPCTIETALSLLAIGSTEGIFGSTYSSTAGYYRGVFFFIDPAGTINLNYGDGTDNDSTGRRSKVSGSAITTDTKTISVSVNAATDIQVYGDGVDLGGSYSGSGGVLDPGTPGGSFGACRSGGTTHVGDFDGAELRVSDIIRSAAWIKTTHYSLTDALLTYGSIENLSGGETLTPESGSYIITGTEANLVDETEAIAATDGTYNIVGFPLHDRIDAGAAIYTITGNEAILIAPVVAEFGQYNIIGQNASIYPSFIIETGNYLITGKEALLIFPFIADPGTYNINGTAADLKYQIVFQGGEYVIIGIPALLSEIIKIVAESGSYEITGTDANVWSNSVPLDLGIYTLMGIAADLKLKLNANSAAYIIDGKPASIFPVFNSNPGEYLISGNSVFIFPSFNTGIGEYTIIGKDALLGMDYFVVAESGEYVIAGTDAFLWENKFICESGSYVITGIDLAKEVIAELAEYIITGIDAEIFQSNMLYPEIGNYEITGTDALLWQNTLYPEAGVYTLTFGTVGYKVKLPAVAGQYIVSGTDAGLSEVLVMVAEIGAYLITGDEITLIIGHNNFSVENGQYSISGSDLDDGITANTTAYDIVGTEANLVRVEDTLVVYSGSYLIRGVQTKSLPRPTRQWVQM